MICHSWVTYKSSILIELRNEVECSTAQNLLVGTSEKCSLFSLLIKRDLVLMISKRIKVKLLELRLNQGHS